MFACFLLKSYVHRIVEFAARMPSHTALDIECKVELTAVLNLMLCKRKAEIAVLIHNRAAPTMPANVNKRWSLNPVEC